MALGGGGERDRRGEGGRYKEPRHLFCIELSLRIVGVSSGFKHRAYSVAIHTIWTGAFV